MEADRVEAIKDLLVRTEEAHGAYETTELNGVYDQEWPRWYAGFAVDNGLGQLLGHEVSAQRVAELLTSAYADFEHSDSKPSEPWPVFIARRFAAEL